MTDKTGMTFDSYDCNARQFSSTFDTAFHMPLAEYSMTAAQIKNVDLMNIYNSESDEAGFIDQITASRHNHWDDYYSPWLDSSLQTQFYITTLQISVFTAARKNSGLLTGYFKESTKVRLAPNRIFPLG